MEANEKVENYYSQDAPFKEGIAHLRTLALETEAHETCKWGMPVYTIKNKNVFGITRFKSYFGVWFFNGALLKDRKKVLRNAQEGKTKAMRHWNFSNLEEIDREAVLEYMREAIENELMGRKVEKGTEKAPLRLPHDLEDHLEKDIALNAAFEGLPAYKRKEYAEYLNSAKRESTRLARLQKIKPMILEGKGLHDVYRKKAL